MSLHLIPKHHMQFSPVEVDDDELTQAIQEDPIVQDDQWQLDEAPDEEALEKFWDEVSQDWEPEIPDDLDQ